MTVTYGLVDSRPPRAPTSPPAASGSPGAHTPRRTCALTSQQCARTSARRPEGRRRHGWRRSSILAHAVGAGGGRWCRPRRVASELCGWERAPRVSMYASEQEVTKFELGGSHAPCIVIALVDDDSRGARGGSCQVERREEEHRSCDRCSDTHQRIRGANV